MFNEHTYTIPNWELNPDLETEVYLQLGIYDALNRPMSQQTGRIGIAMSSVEYSYNEAGLLETVKANASQKGLKDYVKSIDYNEKGQRKMIVYGNNSKTVYNYEKDTFRLSRLETLNPDGKVQDLNYTYDPVGNISTIINLAEDTIFFNNQNVEPSHSYAYDALYRLTQATGREHIGQAGVRANTPDSQTDIFRVNLPHPGNGDALQNYLQSYSYDPIGNMQMMRHIAGLSSFTHRWTKTFSYNNNDHDRQQLGIPLATKKNNQLLAYKQGTNQQNYGFDAHGNMQEIQPNAANGQFDLSWNCFDQLKYIDILAGTAHYWYDASGERSRKVLTDGTNITKERIYFGGLEVYREYNSNSTIKLERETLHIQDDTGRIALVDTKTIDHPSDDTQEQLLRFQYRNHLGSSSLELDEGGKVISYEEYYPYGTTSYQATNKTIKAAAKRYRYTGMERDDESGMNYHSARYYLPWLGRWLKPDPIGIGGGNNIYTYANNNPITYFDINGKEPIKSEIVGLDDFIGLIKKENVEDIEDLFHFYGKTASELASEVSSEKTSEETSDKSNVTNDKENTQIQRYLYSKKWGWIDLKHFAAAANYADRFWFPNRIILSEGRKTEMQQAKDQNDSAYSYEDLPSNLLGVYFGSEYSDSKSSQKKKIQLNDFQKKLLSFLIDIEVVSDPLLIAPNAGNIPEHSGKSFKKIPTPTNRSHTPMFTVKGLELTKGELDFKIWAIVDPYIHYINSSHSFHQDALRYRAEQYCQTLPDQLSIQECYQNL